MSETTKSDETRIIYCHHLLEVSSTKGKFIKKAVKQLGYSGVLRVKPGLEGYLLKHPTNVNLFCFAPVEEFVNLQRKRKNSNYLFLVSLFFFIEY